VIEEFERLKKDCHNITNCRTEKILIVISKNIEAALTEKAKAAVRLVELSNLINEDYYMTIIKQDIGDTKVEAKEIKAVDIKAEEESEIGVKRKAESEGNHERIVGLKNLRKNKNITNKSQSTGVSSNSFGTPGTSSITTGFIKRKVKEAVNTKTRNMNNEAHIEFNEDDNDDCKLVFNIR